MNLLCVICCQRLHWRLADLVIISSAVVENRCMLFVFLEICSSSSKISRTYPQTINGICRYSGSAKDCQEYDCSKCVLSVSYPFIVVVPAP